MSKTKLISLPFSNRISPLSDCVSPSYVDQALVERTSLYHECSCRRPEARARGIDLRSRPGPTVFGDGELRRPAPTVIGDGTQQLAARTSLAGIVGRPDLTRRESRIYIGGGRSTSRSGSSLAPASCIDGFPRRSDPWRREPRQGGDALDRRAEVSVSARPPPRRRGGRRTRAPRRVKAPLCSRGFVTVVTSNIVTS